MRTVDELRAALDYPSGPATADVAAIIRRGQQRRTVRLTGGAGFATVAVVIAIAVVTGLLPNGTGPDIAGDPGGPPSPLLIAAPGPPTAAPERFDPLMRTLHIGWSPEGLPYAALHIQPWKQIYQAHERAPLPGEESPPRGLQVSVLAAGRPIGDLPAALFPTDGVETPADPINGRPATCLSDQSSPGSCRAIRWQYAPNAWAGVSYDGAAADPAETTAILRRVAESVWLTAGEPMRLPFDVEGDLATMPAVHSGVIIGNTGAPGTGWSAWVALADQDTAFEAGGTDAPQLLISLSLELDASPGIEPNSTVEGQRARLSREGDSSRLDVWNDSGTHVAVEYFKLPDDPVAAYRLVRPLPGADDPANWLPLR